MVMVRFLGACLFGFVSFALNAQVVLENDPASARWYRLESPHFHILYVRGFEAQAQRVANNLETIYKPESKTMGVVTKTVPLVLHNLTATSNGFVTMSPPTSEFFAMPSQDYNFTGTLDMLDMLSVHEYRHVVQYTRARTGFSKWLYYGLGPAAFNGMTDVSVPYWFFEGDAVATETAFTRGGRGRIPEFAMLLRTNLLEGRRISYNQQYLGSYKIAIPNHYVLGYHMVSYLRERSDDPYIWERIASRTWKVPFIPFRFSSAVHKESGLYVKDLYREMMDTLKKQWTHQLDSLDLTRFDTISHRSNLIHTNYEFPNSWKDHGVVAQKSGLDDYATFVLITPEGTEKKLYVPGLVVPTASLSVEANRIAWTEYANDWRWQVKSHSCIRVYDLLQKKLIKLDSRENYAGAALSPDGLRVATVRTDSAYQSTLVVLDASSGSVLQEFSNPANDFISMPSWAGDSSIVALKTNTAGRSIAQFNLNTGSTRELVPPSNENIGHPVIRDHYLLFNSAASGIDNVYAIDLITGDRYQVTCSKYGAFSATVAEDGSKIYYNEQTINGLDVASIPFDPTHWRRFNSVPILQHFAAENAKLEGFGNVLDSVPQVQYPVERFRRIRGVVNPYSWGPYVDNDLSGVTVGMISRDVLSTTSISAGYRYDVTEYTGSWGARISYQGLFPIFDLDYRYADRSVDEGIIAVPIGNNQYVLRDLRFRWKEQTVMGTARIPLLSTRGKYTDALTLSGSLGVEQVTDFRNAFTDNRHPFGYPFNDFLDNGNLFWEQWRISASHLLKIAPRDIYSRWAQTVELSVTNTLPSGDFHGGTVAATAGFYFPGLMKHHSFYINGAYQNTLINNRNDDYIFSNQIFYPRGHSYYRFKEFYSGSLNYTMPIWYPDLALGPVLNIKRIRSNFFYDYGYGKAIAYSPDENRYYTSTGVEVKFDFNFMRFLPQLDMGVRYAYGMHPVESRVEVLIGTIKFP